MSNDNAFVSYVRKVNLGLTLTIGLSIPTSFVLYILGVWSIYPFISVGIGIPISAILICKKNMSILFR